MRKTLFLHIGHFKTGTTALQVFLSNNTRFLAKHDIAYAQTQLHLAKHSALAFCLYRAAGVSTLMHGYKRPETPQELWGALFDEVRKSRQSRIIVSSEELMRLGAHPQAANILKDIVSRAPRDIDIRVIAYLRAPDSHLRSWYNQLVKMGVKTPAFNDAACRTIEPIHTDYALALKPWLDIFGPDAVILRPYDEASRENLSLYHDFLGLFGTELPSRGVTLPVADPNPRMDDRMLEMARMMHNAGMPRDVVTWTLERSQKFYVDECADTLPTTEADFDALRQTVLSGLERLQDLPGNGLNLQAYAARLPQREDTSEAEGWRLAGLLLNELHFLRQRMTKENAEINARLRALETALNMGDPSGK
ncbi:sulfotransferase family protein [Thalassobius vesicularis]|uniref:Sulfotransferase family protein n=1 Tax=Thalassobius vesicularis TaxID=1294297 RepID=A0A4S3ME15_9RHOB|nr:sulfotransferase family protein [Thalassobius vesicularis]THD76930.1 sulfotransferase family protein [Thalassobius vesicularis]